MKYTYDSKADRIKERTGTPMSATAGRTKVVMDRSSPAFYTQEYFAGLMEPNAVFILELAEIWKRIKPGQVLELGCGTGRAMRLLKGLIVKGIDVSDYAVNFCRDAGLDVEKADVIALGFPADSFDSVFSMHVMEHVKDLGKALNESVRVAKSRAVHLIPIGPRADKTHEHQFSHLDDLKNRVDRLMPQISKRYYRSETPEGGEVCVMVLDKASPIKAFDAQPFIVVPDFINVVGGTVKSDEPDDFDVVMRVESYSSISSSAGTNFRNLIPRSRRDKLHLISNPVGPHGDHVPIYDLVAVPKEDWELNKVFTKAALAPLQYFTPLKTSKAYTQLEFFAPDAMWEFWAEPFIKEGRAIDIETKYNGFRTVLEWDGSKPLIFFEDTKSNRSKQFPVLVDELKAIGKSAILDADLGAVYANGRVVPRKFLGALVSPKTKVDDEGKFEIATGEPVTIIVHVFDLLYYDGEDLHEKSWAERRKALEKLFGSVDAKFLVLGDKNIVKTKKDFLSTGEKLSKQPGSEGFVAKVIDSDYPLTGSTTSWAKSKNELEIKVIVLDRVGVKGTPKTWNYIVGYKNRAGEVVKLGKTFNTKVDAKEGDILTLAAGEVVAEWKDDKWKLTVVVPRVNDISTATEPEGFNSIVRRAEQANILQVSLDDFKRLKSDKIIKGADITKQAGQLSFKEGNSGIGVLQTHEMGLMEQQIKLAPAMGWEPVELTDAQLDALSEAVEKDIRPAYKKAQKGDSSQLDKLTAPLFKEWDDLNKTQQKALVLASPVAIHSDFRLRPEGEDWWEGGEGFTPGNQFKPNLFKQFSEQEDSKDRILGNFKVPRKGEGGELQVRGPIFWINAGDKKPYVAEPGTEGAKENTWGRLTRRDFFKWTAGVQDEHFKEFWFEGNVLKGRWIWTFAPVAAGGRAWMVGRPKDQTPKSEKLKEKVEKSMTAMSGELLGYEEKIITKSDGSTEEKRLATGVVLKPEQFDLQDHIYSAEVIEETAHDFVARYNDGTKLGKEHKEFFHGQDLQLAESWTAKDDMILYGKKVTKGSWIVTVKVNDDKLWQAVKNGEVTGFSVGGRARMEPAEAS